jgi:hypothetical protein
VIDLNLINTQKWIGNFTSKKKRIKKANKEDLEEPPSKKVKLPSYTKAASGYNMFCAEYFKSGN